MAGTRAAQAAPFSSLIDLQCARCGTAWPADAIAQLCSCGSPLLARYDVSLAARTLTRENLARRPRDLWRYHELLPVRDPARIVAIGESVTPLTRLDKLGNALGLAHLYIKDEGLLPGGSFKARGAAVGVSRARELGVSAFAMPTNGNAGAAWSLYAAKAGLQAHIVMPARAPQLSRSACALAGARVYSVNGLINDAGKIVAKAVAKYGLYDASTLKEPYRIEGKKTLGFEIAEQCGWEPPDVIVYPTGGGVGLIGMQRAFRELAEAGLLKPRMPRFIAVQSSGCAPIVRAWEQGDAVSTQWEGANTVAFGINVPKALGDFLILRILKECAGAAIAVDDADILRYQSLLAQREGIYASPEGGAALAAVVDLLRSGTVSRDERIVLVNTGSGALESGGIPAVIPVLEPDDEISIPASL